MYYRINAVFVFSHKTFWIIRFCFEIQLEFKSLQFPSGFFNIVDFFLIIRAPEIGVYEMTIVLIGSYLNQIMHLNSQFH